ncbi:MarR family winged helix-turn-helix transcriptional regulator [Stappia sp.]|uniref:MarR family winged helix-turn-helix transcriptional regulator n=1 Tax=Stappia sp. TaxID=1870903 RepID=UPI003D0F2C98
MNRSSPHSADADPRQRAEALLERLARLQAAGDWADDLNPTQWTALSYLARANRFSRAPSQVADYLAATRGTVSQTLKALARKGLVEEAASDGDRRSISYEITAEGQAALSRQRVLGEALAVLPEARVAALADGLSDLVATLIEARGGRGFGLCRTCRHHRPAGVEGAGHCRLLDLPLAPHEADRICHEHAA